MAVQPMLFNSYIFGLFLAIVLAVHSMPLPWRTKKINLLLASYIFYATWNPPFVILLWVSTVVDWFAAKGIDTSSRGPRRKLFLGISLLTNLGLLGFFKYGGFLLENLVALAALAGIQYQPPQWDVVLPVGISFYTFQTLSYTFDVYRGKMAPSKSFLDFALYVTFFPQLVAGPIVRAAEFLPQCRMPRRATTRQFQWGLSLLVLGLFQKIVVADTFLAPVADKVYSGTEPGFVDAWTGTLAFAGQIFCDFAGYSTCAIGVAMTLGFALPDNFRFPYAAAGFSDFWRRWHISLSTWLRDYLYIPLGGNRGSKARTARNLAATMLLGGLWHGAAWTFVVWGALHGLLLSIERTVLGLPVARWEFWRRPMGQFFIVAVTFTCVCFTWVFFRSSDFRQAYEISVAMLGMRARSSPELLLRKIEVLRVLSLMGLILSAHWLLRDSTLERHAQRTPRGLLALALAGMLIAIVMSPGDNRAFIYFQF